MVSGMVKGAVFGFIVALMGCYHGMNSGRGAQGVGRATKSAVVAASVLILAANYILTEVFFYIMIELHGLHKSFGQNHVLAGVDLSIERGKSMVIIGGSGTVNPSF